MLNVGQLLLAAGEKLSPAARRQILALGSEAVEPLLELMQGEVCHAHGGYATLHAVRLLGDLGAPQAVEPFLAILQRSPADLLLDAIVLALPKLGPAVLAPALRLHARAGNPELRSLIASVLSELGVQDDRIFQALIEQLVHSPWQGAGSLTVYGDPRAVGPLSEALDAFEIDLADWCNCEACMELAHAICSLGGDLTRSQREKLDAALHVRRFMETRRYAC